MKLWLYFIGKPRDANANGMAQEFLKRSSRYMRCEMREIIRRTHDVSRDVRRERRDAERQHGDDQHDGIFEIRQHLHRIPNRLAEDDGRRGSHRHADE